MRANRRWLILIGWLAALPAGAQPPAEKLLPADQPDGPPVVSARAWAVAEGKTGKLLGGSKEAEPLAIASTTKIMAAWIIFQLAADNAKVLEETVTISERAAKTIGSSAGVRAGERCAVRDLLFGLLLPSGNDAAVALAEHFGPRFRQEGPADDPVALFVGEMNRRAQQMQLTQTRYLDPNGLRRNESSARDLARLTAVALHNPLFARYVQTRRHQCEVRAPDGEKRAVTWNNTNRLLGIEGYDGVKTGSTSAAGSCLVASGRRADNHLIVVVLGCTSNDSRYVDARNLFRWGWQQRGPASQGPR
jgi:D-alanyl-D-alanine carboxypeptidase (penicillin-binding protein 5/6)